MKIILTKNNSIINPFEIQVNECGSYDIFDSQKHNGCNASHALITFFSHMQQRRNIVPIVKNNKEFTLLYDHLENQRLNNVN
jgi:hypothetical protein